MSDIRIDYQLTINKAKKIKELSEDVGRISDRIRGVREDTESCWIGEAASAYRSKSEELEIYIRKIEDKMYHLSETIIRIANIIKEADDASGRDASSLSTGI